MTKVIIQGIDKYFEGDYEYAEGGIEKDGKPSFHISSSKWYNGGKKYSSCTVYFAFENMQEFNQFISSLVEDIKSKKGK